MGIRFDGLSTGINTSALIDSLIALERKPLVLIQDRQAGLEREQGLFQELNTHLLALRDAALAIDNQNPLLTGPTLEEEFLAYKASSSNESIVTATVEGSASPGSVQVQVDALAQVARRFSDGFADATTAIATSGQTLSIDFGGTQPIDITIGAGGASLTDLRDLINSAPNNAGEIRADIFFDGSEHRLIVAGTAPGAANDITLTTDIDGAGGPGSPFLDPTVTQQAASDARIQLLGLAVTRPSNTLTDVIPGVTLELHAVHGAEPPTTIDVARDDAAVEKKLQDLVDAYNTVREFTNAQSVFNADTGTAGPLSGDFTLRLIQQRIPSLLSDQFTFSGNPFTSLGELGLRFDRDGLLSLDRVVLQSALDTDALAVRQLLAGDGTTDGIATRLARDLEPIIRTGDGTLASRGDGLQRQIDSLQETVDRFERRLVQREELLVRRFAAMETLVSRLQAQGGFFSAAFGSSTNGQR